MTHRHSAPGLFGPALLIIVAFGAYLALTRAPALPPSAPSVAYTDPAGAFSFVVPDAFTATDGAGSAHSWSAPAATAGSVLAEISVPQSYEPGTNFSDAWFTVGASSDPSAVAACLKTFSGAASAASPAIIHGVPFTKLLFAGAGAGNRYDTTSYRVVKDGMCYAVEYTVHYGALENYPKGAVQAFDERKITDALDAVARSFRFLH